jgi:molybdopterin-containing oxidoreductase family iron-sulfur binding subunit
VQPAEVARRALAEERRHLVRHLGVRDRGDHVDPPIDAARDDRPLRDGEIVTACQQSCPTQAIVFGDRNDPKSAVARRKASPLDYVLLEELNTRPRTSYAALIRNPNPAIGDGQS